MSLQDAVNEFLDIRHPIPEWRVISMLTEEAGEVQGAFNKWQDGNKRKPRNEADVIEELVQLTGCCFVAAKYYDIPVENLIHSAEVFLHEKITQIEADGWTSDDQMGSNPERYPYS